MRAVIDSDVLIDFLQGNEAARTEINRYDPALYSVISWMEVMCGAENDEERKAARGLFDSMQRVEVTAEVAERAVEERISRKLKLPDAIILASADVEGCILVTCNTKDFAADDPSVRIPYSV